MGFDNAGVGLRGWTGVTSGSTAPTMLDWHLNRWGAKAKPPVFTHLPGGFAVNALGSCMLRESALWPVI